MQSNICDTIYINKNIFPYNKFNVFFGKNRRHNIYTIYYLTSTGKSNYRFCSREDVECEGEDGYTISFINRPNK